jgi:hypothetical protein
MAPSFMLLQLSGCFVTYSSTNRMLIMLGCCFTLVGGIIKHEIKISIAGTQNQRRLLGRVPLVCHVPIALRCHVDFERTK